MTAVAESSNVDIAAAGKVRDVLLDGLKTALTQPGEHRLFRAGRLAGLFPSKHGDSGEAARQALAAGLLEHTRTEMRGSFIFEWVRSTTRTAGFVADHDSPKAILRELADVLGETKAGVPVWMEQARAELRTLSNQFESRAAAMLERLDSLAGRIEDALRRADAEAPARWGREIVPWAEVAFDHLDRRRDSGTPVCPLSELFHVVRDWRPQLTIADFHDGVRRLAEVNAIQYADGNDDPEFAIVFEGTLQRAVRR
jgi:hypothetical protein